MNLTTLTWLTSWLFHISSLRSYLSAAFHVVRFLKGMVDKGLFYSLGSAIDLHAHSDADWGACHLDRKSLTSYFDFLWSSLISCKTKKQIIASTSSGEAEYQSIAAAMKELLWISYLLCDLHVNISLLVTLFADSKSAKLIINNPYFHAHTKHINYKRPHCLRLLTDLICSFCSTTGWFFD